MLTPPLVPELIAELACGAADRAQFERELFDQLERHIGFDVGFFVDETGVGPVAPGLDAQVLHQALPHWDRMSVEIEELVAAGREQRGVVIDKQVFGARLARTTYYDVFMRPHAGHCTLFGLVAPRGDVVAELVLGRAGTSPEYRAEEAQRLRRLMPTLSLAAASFRPPARRGVARPPSAEHGAELSSLTAREREALSYLGLGYTNAQIALALGSRERTVRNQLSSAYRKMGVASRAEAVGVLSALASNSARSAR